MKIKFGKIAILIMSLAVIIGVTFSMSSCSSVMDFVDGIIDIGNSDDGDASVTPLPDDGDEENKIPESDKDSEDDSANTDDGKDNTNTDTDTEEPEVPDSGEEDEDAPLEFYPGMGSVPAENISAKNRTLLSTVVIISQFGQSPSAGSGVFYEVDRENGNAYVITNYHVVYNNRYGMCDSLKLYLYGMRYADYAIDATVLGGSAAYDIAVLKVEGSEVLKNSYAMAASLGNSDDVRVFDEVFAVGNPEGFGMAVTEGIISVDSEDLEMTGADGSAIELRVMRVSAAINEGNSGGGLYDAEGKLIGIVCAKRIGSEVDNMAYAIPSNLAKNLVENIIYFCSDGSKEGVQRPLIGITITAKIIGIVADGETGEIKKAEVIEVSELTETCIAKDVVKVGDIVNSITVNGVTIQVTRLYHIIDHMLTARVGSEVVMNVTRDGEPLDVTFTVPESAFTTVR